jgi:hypothetical protein
MKYITETNQGSTEAKNQPKREEDPTRQEVKNLG